MVRLCQPVQANRHLLWSAADVRWRANGCARDKLRQRKGAKQPGTEGVINVRTRNAVTLRDIALISGVSVSTVSRVLNNTGRVSTSTRQMVMDAAERLDFRPNALAQFFATGRSHTVAMLAQRANDTFARKVIVSVANRLAREDVAVVIYDAEEQDVSGRPENIRKLHARQIDGLIVIGDGGDRVLPSISRLMDRPVVYAYAVSDDKHDPAFIPDDRMAGRLAAEHLLETGRRRIAYVAGPARSDAMERRSEGAQAALDGAGIDWAIPPRHGAWTREWGRKAAEEIALRIDELDAIMCGNDFIAMGLTEVLAAQGIRVPDDVAITGHDQWEQYVDEDPFLTSVDPMLATFGEAAAAHLLALIAGDQPTGGVHELPCRLVVGRSTSMVRRASIDG